MVGGFSKYRCVDLTLRESALLARWVPEAHTGSPDDFRLQLMLRTTALRVPQGPQQVLRVHTQTSESASGGSEYPLNTAQPPVHCYRKCRDCDRSGDAHIGLS